MLNLCSALNFRSLPFPPGTRLLFPWGNSPKGIINSLGGITPNPWEPLTYRQQPTRGKIPTDEIRTINLSRATRRICYLFSHQHTTGGRQRWWTRDFTAWKIQFDISKYTWWKISFILKEPCGTVSWATAGVRH